MRGSGRYSDINITFIYAATLLSLVKSRETQNGKVQSGSNANFVVPPGPEFHHGFAGYVYIGYATTVWSDVSQVPVGGYFTIDVQASATVMHLFGNDPQFNKVDRIFTVFRWQ